MCWTGFECLTLILPPVTSTSLLALSANICFFSCCCELWLWVSLRRGEVRVSTGQTQAYSLTLCTLKASDKSHKAPLAPLTWLPTIYESSGFQCGAKLTTFFFFKGKLANQRASFQKSPQASARHVANYPHSCTSLSQSKLRWQHANPATIGWYSVCVHRVHQERQASSPGRGCTALRHFN